MSQQNVLTSTVERPEARRPLSKGQGRKGLALSVLDLVPVVEGGTSVAALRGAADLARAVDRLGFSRLWYGEHHNSPGIAATAPDILIAHVGAMTTRIRLGAGGVMVPNHAPLKVAEVYKLLNAIYPDRIDLGIGRAGGTDPLTVLALRRSRNCHTPEEFLGQVAAWGAEGFPPEHPLATVRAVPDDGRLPPMYLLGSTDQSARLAAKWGCGFAFAGHFSPEPAEPAVRAYRAEFSNQGRFERPYAIMSLAVHCADTEEAAKRLASSMILGFTQGRTQRPRRLPSPDEAMSHVFTPEEAPIASFFRELQIVGTPEQVRARIEEVAARSAVDEVMISTHAYDLAARIRSYELLAQVFDLARDSDRLVVPGSASALNAPAAM